MATAIAAQLLVEEVPSVAAALCTAVGRAGRCGDDQIVAAVARWRGHPGGLVHRAALTGLARVQADPDHACLAELVRCLILPATDNWRHWTPELKTVYAASSALGGRRPSEVPRLADLLIARLSQLRPDESSVLALPLLLGFAFPDGPLPDGTAFTDLTRMQRDVVHILLDSDELERNFGNLWEIDSCNLPSRSAALLAWASAQPPLF
jgi:hypothetical protein